jgi:peptidoglycan hydrolase CwlO-like protein
VNNTVNIKIWQLLISTCSVLSAVGGIWVNTNVQIAKLQVNVQHNREQIREIQQVNGNIYRELKQMNDNLHRIELKVEGKADKY